MAVADVRRPVHAVRVTGCRTSRALAGAAAQSHALEVRTWTFCTRSSPSSDLACWPPRARRCRRRRRPADGHRFIVEHESSRLASVAYEPGVGRGCNMAPGSCSRLKRGRSPLAAGARAPSDRRPGGRSRRAGWGSPCAPRLLEHRDGSIFRSPHLRRPRPHARRSADSCSPYG